MELTIGKHPQGECQDSPKKSVHYALPDFMHAPLGFMQSMQEIERLELLMGQKTVLWEQAVQPVDENPVEVAAEGSANPEILPVTPAE